MKIEPIKNTMISRFYVFHGNVNETVAKIKQVRDTIKGSIKQMAGGFTIAGFHENKQAYEAAKAFGLTEVPIGSMQWRYYFENAREHLMTIVPLEALTTEQIDEVITMIGKKAGHKLEYVEPQIWTIPGGNETPFEFMSRMNQELAVVDGMFRHRAKLWKFSKTGLDEK